MANASASGVEDDILLLRKLFNLAVLLQVLLGLVLDIVIEGHDDLVGVIDLGGTNAHELEGYGPGVVVCHALVWLQGDIVAGTEDLALGYTNSMALDNLFGESLGCLWGFLECGEEASCGALLEGMEDVLVFASGGGR